jgi:hypothetical protein
MTIRFEKLRARLLANPKVKAEYDALAPEFYSKSARRHPHPNPPPQAREREFTAVAERLMLRFKLSGSLSSVPSLRDREGQHASSTTQPARPF